MKMTLLSVSSSLLLAVLLATLSCTTDSAPTHHLTVGVQGNTPTLIVTSSEIGITTRAASSAKNFVKGEYVAKSLKDLNATRKLAKVKLDKNLSAFSNKKEKFKYFEKPSTKQTSEKKTSLDSTISLGFKEDIHETFQQPTIVTENLEFLATITSEPTTAASTENVSIFQASRLYTRPAEKKLNATPPKVSASPQKNTEPQEEVMTPSLPANMHSPTFSIQSHRNLKVSTTTSTTLDTEDFEDDKTNTNYKDDTNADIIADVSTETQAGKSLQIVVDTSVIRKANVDDDGDGDADSSVTGLVATTESENLLFSTIETKTFYTPTACAAASSPTSVTLATDKADATVADLPSTPLIVTTMATENDVRDTDSNKRNEQQQQTATGSSNKSKNWPPEIESHYQEAQQAYGDLKPTEHILLEASQDSLLNATSSKYLQFHIEVEGTTEAPITLTTGVPASRSAEQQLFDKLKTSEEHPEATTKIPDEAHELFPAATTEGVLKLIDLEKHVVKTIYDLKQPSPVMAGQHDNGHDGLKNIKKKQLVDKHYAESLLHNKQDAVARDLDDIDKYLPQTTHATDGTRTLSSSPSRSLLVPIKRGYLGPIVMEEKTFHISQHDAVGTSDKNRHIDDIQSQLRKGHFVELKAKPEGANSENGDNRGANTNETTSSKTKPELELEMQSDQPVKIIKDQNVQQHFKDTELNDPTKHVTKYNDFKQIPKKSLEQLATSSTLEKEQPSSSSTGTKTKTLPDEKPDLISQINLQSPKLAVPPTASALKSASGQEPQMLGSAKQLSNRKESEESSKVTQPRQYAGVLSTTVFQVSDFLATKTPMLQADTLFTSADIEKQSGLEAVKQQTESKISDIQIEVYDSTVDSIVASTNFKEAESKHQPNAENFLGKTTKPPVAAVQQERFTQYVIDRTETSTPEPINYSTIQVGSGKPEPAAIEIHINVSESFGNESDDADFSYPQTAYSNKYNEEERTGEMPYDDNKVSDDIKLKISSNFNGNGKELRNNEILVVEIIDTDNNTEPGGKSKSNDELFITDVKDSYNTPPPPPPPPPYQTGFDRDSDTIFYISNTEVKVGESLPAAKSATEERKLKLESQFFPANYMASTHSTLNNAEESNPTHHLYEEDIILSSSRNQADALKIYRNNNEPSPPLDVTYVGESIIEVEQSPESVLTTTYGPEQQQQQHTVATTQADVIIQPAILPEISIGVPVIGELPPQIELKEIDFMPSEAELHRSGIYDDNDNSNSNNNNNDNDIDENTISSSSNNNHDVDVVSGNNNNNNQHTDDSSIQYGGDLIDESADGGFDGVEGSYPFGNPVAAGKTTSSSSYSSAFLSRLRKQQPPNHVADYTHLYVNYGVNNMRKDELSADVKDSGEMLLIGSSGGSGGVSVGVGNEQNASTFKDFLSKVSMNNSTMPFASANSTQGERMSNATAFSVMEDANDLVDRSTEDIINLISLAIGLFIVILPVVVTCSMFWALRYLYKKYHTNLTDTGGYTDQTETKSPLNEDGAEKGEFVHETSSSPTNSNKDRITKYPDTSNKPSTTDSNVRFSSEKPTPHLETTPSKTNTAVANSSCANFSTKNETLRLSLPLSCPNTQKTQAQPPPSASSPQRVATTNDCTYSVPGDVDGEDGNEDAVQTPGPNGSITKMTLENNLLIVETEERNDMSRVARETKMDYNKDGVFVVEVARGVDSKTIPDSPVAEANEKMFSMFDVKKSNGGLGYKMANEKNCVNNEKVQIHSPPPENHDEGPRSLHQIEEVEEPINSPQLTENDNGIPELAYKAHTGLSQSDLSSTSSSDSNKGYCYGNQELYVVEQKGYSAATPNGSVVLKCEGKDIIKDDDHNPGNDHYLTHSPDKKEEISKDHRDIVETAEKSEEGSSSTGCTESPNQKPNDELEAEDIEKLQEAVPEEENASQDAQGCNNEFAGRKPPVGGFDSLPKSSIPVEIEVHVTPEPADGYKVNTMLSLNESVSGQSSLLEEPEKPIQPLTSDNIADIGSRTPNKAVASVVPDTISGQKSLSDDANSTKVEQENANGEKVTENIEELEKIIEDHSSVEVAPKANEPLVNHKEEMPPVEKEHYQAELPNSVQSNGMVSNTNPELVTNGSDINKSNDEMSEGETALHANVSTTAEARETLKNKEVLNMDLAIGTAQPTTFSNGTSTLPDLVTEAQTQQLQNGHVAVEDLNDSLNETENGYDSILSLPEPPPTTDEQLNSDLNDQQLDSLPPPPPPEIFCLKDLTPPLTNGNGTDFPQAKESNHFYSTLPHPPATAMEVTLSAETTTNTTAANGKVHVSPLTPPASPPAHFTNNLHPGLCSQPIAVNVNGS